MPALQWVRPLLTASMVGTSALGGEAARSTAKLIASAVSPQNYDDLQLEDIEELDESLFLDDSIVVPPPAAAQPAAQNDNDDAAWREKDNWWKDPLAQFEEDEEEEYSDAVQSDLETEYDSDLELLSPELDLTPEPEVPTKSRDDIVGNERAEKMAAEKRTMEIAAKERAEKMAAEAQAAKMAAKERAEAERAQKAADRLAAKKAEEEKKAQRAQQAAERMAAKKAEQAKKAAAVAERIAAKKLQREQKAQALAERRLERQQQARLMRQQVRDSFSAPMAVLLPIFPKVFPKDTMQDVDDALFGESSYDEALDSDDYVESDGFDSPSSSSLPKFRRPEFLERIVQMVPSGGNRAKIPSAKQLLEERDSLLVRVQRAERERDNMEREYEKSSWQLQEVQSDLSAQASTTSYLKAQLRDTEQMLERAVRAERDRAREELKRMKEAMLRVLERERQGMRDEVKRQTAELQALLKEANSGGVGE